MRRWLIAAAVTLLLAAGCAVEPLDDPGIGARALTTVVLASDGTVIAEWHAEEDRTLVEYDQIPKSLQDAVVGIEDERFWQHTGVDLKAVARALVANVQAGDVVEGGSTITQQYLKNVLLTPDVTVDRKVEEAILALRLEEGLSKEEILERYMNTVYFGNGAYGVGTAARTYFDKPVEELDLAEAALLAGLIKAPSRTDPYRSPDAAVERRNVVIEKLRDLRWVTDEAADAALAAPLELAPGRAAPKSSYPYFVEEVKRRLLDDPALGATATDRYNAVFRGGLRIHTTIDPMIQTAAEAAVADVLPDDGPAAAVAAIDPRTGHVLALVGGRDFYDETDPIAQFNLATQGHRQPGSAFKPFTLAAAIEGGATLEEVFAAGRSVVIETDSGPWTVENYGGSTFPNLTLLEATVFSVNVVYARLVDLVGPEVVAELAARVGIESPLQPFHSIALGAQEVTPLELASAYGTFAAGGVHVDPIFVTSIEDSAGVNVYEAVPVVTESLSRTTAETVTAALSEVVSRGTGQQARIGRPVAGKTGTSQEHRDAWFVGYTSELVAAVWVGFPDTPQPMEYPATPYTITGGTWPAHIWSRFASAALSGVPYGELATYASENMVTVEIDVTTGFLAGPYTPRENVQRLRLPRESAPSIVDPINNPQGIVAIGAGTLPDVIGLGVGEAVGALTAAGFQAIVEWQDGGPLAVGTIFGQIPSGGTPAQSGSTVRLIAAGPEPGTTIPSLLGLPLPVAADRLTVLGVDFVVITESESDPNAAAARRGLVWKQDPAAGADISAALTIWVNP